MISHRVARELRRGWVASIGFGISANVSRVFLAEGIQGSVTRVIELGTIGGVPLLGCRFGCAANAEAFVTSPHPFSHFRAGGSDAALPSLLEVDAQWSVNPSGRASTPHRTAGIVDITARAGKIVFPGLFNAGSKMGVGRLAIRREGSIARFVPRVDQVSLSGPRAVAEGQEVSFITKRCEVRLIGNGSLVTEIAPGISLQRDVFDQSRIVPNVAPELREMDTGLFQPEPMGLGIWVPAMPYPRSAMSRLRHCD